MEQEAKYRLLDQVKPKHIEHMDWQEYTLGERVSKQLCDTILDTADRRLSAQKHSLRVRQDGDNYLLTLKTAGELVGAIHSRQEIEVPIRAEHVQQRASWPEAIGGPIEELISGAELQPILEIRNKRRVWLVQKQGLEVAELALDRGTIYAGERSLEFHELEIERKGHGSLEDIEALAAFLSTTLPMQPEKLSKRERGSMLLEQRENVPALAAVELLTPMTPAANLAEAGRSIVAMHAQKLHEMLPIARIGEDPEGVHKSRVSIRRIRAVLAALSEAVYDPAEVKKLRRGLKHLAQTLGEVRDPDVFLIKLHKDSDQLPPAAAAQMEPLIAMMQQRRDQGRKYLLASLDKAKTQRLLERLDTFVATEGAGVRPFDGAEAEMPRTLVRHWAGSMLWSHYERVRAYEVNLASAAPETLHELRIEIKYLRYTLELFMDALTEEAAALHEQLVAAQDHLGDIQDAEVALELVDQILKDHPDAEALYAYRTRRSHERTALVERVPKAVGPILGLPFRRRLASVISKL